MKKLIWLLIVLTLSMIWTSAFAGLEKVSSRPLTFAELDNIRVTTPILHIVAGVPSFYMYAWVSKDNISWKMVFQSDLYWRQQNGNRNYYVLLDNYYRFIRVGTTGYYTGSVGIDAVELVLPNGTILSPTAAFSINRATSPDAVLIADGSLAVVSHTAGPGQEQIDAVQVNFPKHRPLKLVMPRIAVQTPTFGVYANVAGDQDPHHVPPGYIYYPDPTAYALYDFSIPQSNKPNFLSQVRQINPTHKVILRITPGAQILLDYYYDELSRQQIRQDIITQIDNTPQNLYGVSLSEEELMYQFWGYYSEVAPAWLTEYQSQYEAETGKTFVHQSEEVRKWLIEKAKFFYNDLYDTIKVDFPQLKVLPFLYLPRDYSGWGWLEPSEIKKDGWIYQWLGADEASLLKSATHSRPEITEICVRERIFNIGIAELQKAGVSVEEIYVQVWAYDPTMPQVLKQIEEVRKVGVQNIFVFYYAAWIPVDPATVQGSSNITGYPYWKFSYEQRRKFEKYITKMRRRQLRGHRSR